MNNLRNRIITFMSGRNGFDTITLALMILYAIVGAARAFVRKPVAAYILLIIDGLILLYALWRIFSKNIYKRREEEAAFRRLLGKARTELVLIKDRIKDIRTKRYRRCPSCKNVLRLPYKRGRHNVICPRCGTGFDVHII